MESNSPNSPELESPDLPKIYIQNNGAQHKTSIGLLREQGRNCIGTPLTNESSDSGEAESSESLEIRPYVDGYQSTEAGDLDEIRELVIERQSTGAKGKCRPRQLEGAPPIRAKAEGHAVDTVDSKGYCVVDDTALNPLNTKAPTATISHVNKDDFTVFSYHGRQPRSILAPVLVLEVFVQVLPRVFLGGSFIFPNVVCVKILAKDISVMERQLPDWLRLFPKLREIYVGHIGRDGVFVNTLEFGCRLYRLIAKVPSLTKINGKRIRGNEEYDISESGSNTLASYLLTQYTESTLKPQFESNSDLDLFGLRTGSRDRLAKSCTGSCMGSEAHKPGRQYFSNVQPPSVLDTKDAISTSMSYSFTTLSGMGKRGRRKFVVSKNLQLSAARSLKDFRLPDIPLTNSDYRQVMPINQLMSFIFGLCKFIEKTSRSSRGESWVAYKSSPLFFLTQYSRLVYGSGVTCSQPTQSNKIITLSLANVLSSLSIIAGSSSSDNYLSANPYILWAYHAIVTEDAPLHIHLEVSRVTELLKSRFIKYLKAARKYKIQEKINLMQTQQRERSVTLARSFDEQDNIPLVGTSVVSGADQIKHKNGEYINNTGRMRANDASDDGGCLYDTSLCQSLLFDGKGDTSYNPMGHLSGKALGDDFPGIVCSEVADLSSTFKVASDIVSDSRPLIIGKISKRQVYDESNINSPDIQSSSSKGGLETFLAKTFPIVYGSGQPVPFIEGEIITFSQLTNRVIISVIGEWMRRTQFLKQIFLKHLSKNTEQQNDGILDLSSANALEKELKSIGFDVSCLNHQIRQEFKLSFTDLCRSVIGESLIIQYCK